MRVSVRRSNSKHTCNRNLARDEATSSDRLGDDCRDFPLRTAPAAFGVLAPLAELLNAADEPGERGDQYFLGA